MEKEDEIMKRYQDSSGHVGKAEGRRVLRFLPYKSPYLYLLGCGSLSQEQVAYDGSPAQTPPKIYKKWK